MRIDVFSSFMGNDELPRGEVPESAPKYKIPSSEGPGVGRPNPPRFLIQPFVGDVNMIIDPQGLFYGVLILGTLGDDIDGLV